MFTHKRQWKHSGFQLSPKLTNTLLSLWELWYSWQSKEVKSLKSQRTADASSLSKKNIDISGQALSSVWRSVLTWKAVSPFPSTDVVWPAEFIQQFDLFVLYF